MTDTRAAAAIVDYARSLDCIHCGLCLNTCPTYQLTGSEASSPRGRVHLMRAVAEAELDADAAFAEEMDFCLVCRHCESVCPAGVQFGTMMEFTRDALARTRPQGMLERFGRWLGFKVILPQRAALRLSVSLLGFAQRSGLLRLGAPLFGQRGRALLSFPAVPKRSERHPLPARRDALGTRHEAAALLEGCVMPEVLGRVNRATAEVLGACGVECHSAPEHVCCGALHAHNGELDGARELARGTIAAFERLPAEGPGPLPVVVNSAGCGAHMKEYGRLLGDDPEWSERARAFSARVVDLAEYLADPVRLERLTDQLDDAVSSTGVLTYDDPCHLCHGQGVRAQPRQLLDAIAGTERVELEGAESCCGSAGVYSILRPVDSREMLAPKLEALRRSGARTLVTANPGCQLQWQAGVQASEMDVEVLHLAEVLAARLRKSPG
ncbi:MAG: glycolate oxidase iron-sulfur subunit [Chlamydiales bacterium]